MRRKLLRVGILLICLAAPFVIWRLWLRHDVNGRLAAIRQAGLPANGKELNDWYKAVPNDKNAAPVLKEAFALIQNYPHARSNQIWNFKIPTGNLQLGTEQLELLRGFVQMNSGTLAKAKEALELPACRYPVDFSLLGNTPLAHLANLDTLSKLMSYEAILAVNSGEPKRASDDAETILALARTLDLEPCVLSQVVRLKLFKTAVGTLERRLNAGGVTDAEAASLVTAFARTAVTNCMVRALIGERAYIAAYFRLSKAEVDRLFPPAKAAEEGEKASPLPHKGPFILRLAGYYDLDLGQFLVAMGTNITLAGRTTEEKLKADAYFRRAGEASRKRYRTISASTLTSLTGVMARGIDAEAFHIISTTALAIERFRNQHQRLPEKLEELTPVFLPEVPKDPFSEFEQLRYRPTEKGYVLYSVGRDQKDNGGLEETDKKKSEDGKSFDLVFRVAR